MNYTGKMKNVDNGRGHFYFTLAQKQFVGCGADVLRKLRRLVGKKITLTNPSDCWLSNNSDHCFIEEMRRVGPNHFEVFLGS